MFPSLKKNPKNLKNLKKNFKKEKISNEDQASPSWFGSSDRAGVSTETSQLPESSLAKKERGREVLWASTFKYLDILHLQMLVLSGKFVSKMNYNRCSLLTRFLTLANTAGHHFLNPCFLISERLYTVASDFLSIERIKTSFIVSFLYCLSPHYVRSKWYKILFTIK